LEWITLVGSDSKIGGSLWLVFTYDLDLGELEFSSFIIVMLYALVLHTYEVSICPNFVH